MSYRDGAGQYVPPGYERLSIIRDRIGVDVLRDKLATGKLRAFEIWDEDGGMHPISENVWISERGTGMLHFGYSAPQFYRYANGWAPLDHREKDRARLIVIGSLERVAAVDPINKGGAPRRYNWEGAQLHLARLAYQGSIKPEESTLADIVRHMMDWFIENGGKTPGETEAKTHARQFLTEMKKE